MIQFNLERIKNEDFLLYDEVEYSFTSADYDDRELKEIAEDRMRMYHEVSRFYSYREGKEIVRWKGEYYNGFDIKRRSRGYTCLVIGACPYIVSFSIRRSQLACANFD